MMLCVKTVQGLYEPLKHNYYRWDIFKSFMSEPYWAITYKTHRIITTTFITTIAITVMIIRGGGMGALGSRYLEQGLAT